MRKIIEFSQSYIKWTELDKKIILYVFLHYSYTLRGSVLIGNLIIFMQSAYNADNSLYIYFLSFHSINMYEISQCNS